METYIKKQWTGNENGWGTPIKELAQVSLPEQTVNELNSQFRNTGIKYEAGTMKVQDVTADQADHGNKDTMVKDGEIISTDNKPLELQKQVAEDNKIVAAEVKDAKPGDTTFVDGAQHIAEAIDQKAADKLNRPAGTAGNQ